MKIHSDVLVIGSFYNAAEYTGVSLDPCERVGSRSRTSGYKFSLLGTSSYQRGFGMGGQAATWDEWGIFLAYLFQIDPNAHCGKGSYQSAEHFHWITGNRFATLKPEQQHKRHKWGLGQSVATGVYSVAECDCGAIQRWLLNGYVWEDISILQLG